MQVLNFTDAKKPKPISKYQNLRPTSDSRHLYFPEFGPEKALYLDTFHAVKYPRQLISPGQIAGEWL